MELDTEVRMPSCMMAMQGLGDTGVMYPNVTIDRPSCMYTLSPHSSPDMFENKYYVHSSKENVRGAVCKRRLDFSEDHSQDYLAFHKTPTVAVARRNERERNRVKLINLTFATLREHIPSQSKNGKAKKMSKVDTLKAAIDYIRYLQQLVDEHDAVSNVMDNTCGQRRTQTSTTKNNDLKLDSKPSSSAASPCSENSEGGLSIEEEELLDFAAWF